MPDSSTGRSKLFLVIGLTAFFVAVGVGVIHRSMQLTARAELFLGVGLGVFLLAVVGGLIYRRSGKK
jgi:hypothetical protein